MIKPKESPAAAQENKADTATTSQPDDLLAFASWYFREASPVPQPPFFDGVVRVGAFSGITLFRMRQFQVQLWLCDPNANIPEHSHPGVDVLQVYIWGQVYLTHNGIVVIGDASMGCTPDGISAAHGTTIRVSPGDTHGAKIGPMGGAFMTIQKWLDGEPRSVETAWEGEPLSPEHAADLEARKRLNDAIAPA